MSALRYGLAVMGSTVWAATFGKYIVVGGPSPPPELSAIMLAIVTWAMGSEVRDAVRRRSGKNGDA